MGSHRTSRYQVRLLLAGLIVVAVALLVFETIGMWRTMEFGSPGTDDFIEYWSAGQLFLQGKNPYDFDELLAMELSLGAPYEFPKMMWNPPWLLLWIVPLLLLPFRVAALAWWYLNTCLLLLCGTVIWRLLTPAKAWNRVRIEVALIATVAFVPGWLAIRLGQVSVLLLVGVAGFVYCIARDKPVLGGMLLALTTIKPHMMYLLWIAVAWWVITERQWKVAVGAGVAMVISIGVLTAISPISLAGYQRALASPPLYWLSATLGTILRLLIFKSWPGAQYLPSVVGGLLLAGYLLTRRPCFDWRTALSPLLLVSVATAAYGWTFDQTLLLVPYLRIVAWLVGEEMRTKVQQKLLIVAALLCIGAIMVIGNRHRVSDHFFFWVPWALAAVYAYAQARVESKA